jgi:hypothetical protein
MHQDVEGNVLRFDHEVRNAEPTAEPLIPAVRFTTVKFESPDAEPVRVLGELYDPLKLGGFGADESLLQARVDARTGHAKNRYRLTPKSVKKVTEQWCFAAERWGYPSPISV